MQPAFRFACEQGSSNQAPFSKTGGLLPLRRETCLWGRKKRHVSSTGRSPARRGPAWSTMVHRGHGMIPAWLLSRTVEDDGLGAPLQESGGQSPGYRPLPLHFEGGSSLSCWPAGMPSPGPSLYSTEGQKLEAMGWKEPGWHQQVRPLCASRGATPNLGDPAPLGKRELY